MIKYSKGHLGCCWVSMLRTALITIGLISIAILWVEVARQKAFPGLEPILLIWNAAVCALLAMALKDSGCNSNSKRVGRKCEMLEEEEKE